MLKKLNDLPRIVLALLFLLLVQAAGATSYRWEGVDRIVVLTDAHGAFPALVQMLQKASVIDDNLHWIGGNTHLVSLGDNVDRGPESRKILDLLMRLQTAAPESGGMVHVLNGNHEVMDLTGELSYVAPEEYAAFIAEDTTPLEGFPPGFLGHRRAFSLDGHYGAWLVQRPFVIVINDTAFVHGGLSTELAGLDLDGINQRAQEALVSEMRARDTLLASSVITHADNFRDVQEKAMLAAPNKALDDGVRDAAASLGRAVQGLPFTPRGPVWYRRTAMCHPFNEYPVTLDILDELDAERVFVGHTVNYTHRVGRRLDGRVYRLDTGMLTAYYGGIPAATVIEAGKVSVYYADRDGPSEPYAEANREWERPYGMTDADMEEFLRTATVVEDEELTLGITKPHRLTLEKNGKRLRAVFKTEDSHKGLESGRWDRSGENSDRYVYDVAAYKLDRYMGLDMVPVAVLRQHDGHEGVVQYWVENAINEVSRREKEIPYTGYCDPNVQWGLMDAFDILIHNEDRNQGNILWDRHDWYLWLIDHTRAFRTTRQPPRYLSGTKVIPSDPFATALEKLQADNLGSLTEYLNRSQIKALQLRAEKLLRNR